MLARRKKSSRQYLFNRQKAPIVQRIERNPPEVEIPVQIGIGAK